MQGGHLMGASFEFDDGFARIQNILSGLGKKANTVENKAIAAGAEIVRKSISDEAPRSDQSRKPAPPTQTWRTGEHAADHITASKVKNVDYTKVVEVGISRGDNSEYFYLKFHEFGTAKMPPNPFIERALTQSKDKAKEAIKDVFKEELGL
jgi:HK97 gp10 family phage protein